VSEHRWQIPCEMGPDEAELELADAIEEATDENWESFKHIETVGFFGWTLRTPDDAAIGVSVPQPGGPDKLVVRSENEKLGRQVVDTLTSRGPLAGREATHIDRTQ